METNIPQVEWRCRKCGGLLGVERGGRIHLKYRRAQFVVRGEVMAVCHRCSELNETQSAIAPEGRPSPAGATAFPHQKDTTTGHGARRS